LVDEADSGNAVSVAAGVGRGHGAAAQPVPSITFLLWQADSRGAVRKFDGPAAAAAILSPGSEWIDLVHPEERADAVAHWNSCVRAGKSFYCEARLQLQMADGYRSYLIRAIPAGQTDLTFPLWDVAAMDITEQKRREEKLKATNLELEQFTFTACHDLKEPVRNLALSCQVLQLEYRPQLDASADQFLVYISDAARRMEALVDDLLDYTRSSVVTAVPDDPLDLNLVVRDVLEDLHTLVEETGAVVYSHPLPALCMQQFHIEQVFHHLIENSLVYRSKKVPEIDISAEEVGGAWRFAIKDNGIGIEPEYHDTIFGLFKRLQKRDELSGSGIGLATCRKIIESYGGRIWVESRPGNGSTFFFSLPPD
jgi:signal transduction histidine kinase